METEIQKQIRQQLEQLTEALVASEGMELVDLEYRRQGRRWMLRLFIDKDGGVTRHPMAPDWPREMLTTVRFADEQGRTRVSVEWLPIGASDTELRAFDQGRDSMTQGWGGTFEQLVAYLAHD